MPCLPFYPCLASPVRAFGARIGVHSAPREKRRTLGAESRETSRREDAMTSRVFKARTSHTPSNPQLCGLTLAEITKGDLCLFLVCHGAEARPEWQVRLVGREAKEGSSYKRNIFESEKTGQPFFSVWTGEWESYKDANGKTKRRRVYEWQVEGDDGRRYPVEVWSNMVRLSAAEELGYDIPRDGDGKVRKTTAFKGDRTKGWEQRVAKDSEAPLVTLAKVMLDDEEAGLVAPAEEAVIEEILDTLDGKPADDRNKVPF
jgi:hypothetical protein